MKALFIYWKSHSPFYSVPRALATSDNLRDSGLILAVLRYLATNGSASRINQLFYWILITSMHDCAVKNGCLKFLHTGVKTNEHLERIKGRSKPTK
jgi:hypothetical protein